MKTLIALALAVFSFLPLSAAYAGDAKSACVKVSGAMYCVPGAPAGAREKARGVHPGGGAGGEKGESLTASGLASCTPGWWACGNMAPTGWCFRRCVKN